LRIAQGEAVGTRFRALETPLEHRKRWIYAGAVPSGRLHVDAGAADALRVRGSSLLPAGVRSVEGRFERGDTVQILGPDGRELGRGITRYDSEDVRRIQGCHSDRIGERLGYAYGPVVVHRDDLILT